MECGYARSYDIQLHIYVYLPSFIVICYTICSSRFKMMLCTSVQKVERSRISEGTGVLMEQKSWEGLDGLLPVYVLAAVPQGILKRGWLPESLPLAELDI